MAIGRYRGVDGIARKATKRHRGVDGVARQIVKGYRGVNGVARKYFDDGSLKVTCLFTPASNVKGTPYYSCEANDNNLTMTMTSARTSRSDYNTDRNMYEVSIKGIIEGDVVDFTFIDPAPLASQAVDIFYGSTTIKDWATSGTTKISFTATTTANLRISITDGDYNTSPDTITCKINNFKVNGNAAIFNVS